MEQEKLELRAPRAGEWIRVRPGDDRSEVILVRDDDGVVYLVAENMVEHMRSVAPEKMEPTVIFVCANLDGESFLWPVRAPVPDHHPAWLAIDEWICFESLQLQ